MLKSWSAEATIQDERPREDLVKEARNRKHKHNLSPEEHAALQDFKRRLRRRCGDGLIAIKLFGSRAVGDVRPEPDIDLLVIFKRGTKKDENILVETICDILNVHGVYLEVMSYSRQEYEQSKREQWPFVLNLEKEAVPV